jgi:hypothetical protein
MGLDIGSEDGQRVIFHGAYSAFMRFRSQVAFALGAKEFHKVYGGWALPQVLTKDNAMSGMALLMQRMEAMSCVSENKEYLEERAALKQSNPDIFILLDHSDCDGHWTPQECKKVATLLKTALPELCKLPKDGGHIGDWKTKTELFIEGLEYCVQNNQRAEFS